MSILLTAPAAAKADRITIKGLAYSVSKIDPGEEGTAAYRLDKVHGQGVYDIVRTHGGLVRCDCPDYECRKAGTAELCKHGRALIEAGYLERPSPIANPSPVLVAIKPAVRPITRADQVAARTWGLKLPVDAPLAVEALAPAPVAPVVEQPAPVVALAPAVEPVEPETDEEGPAWTWDTWTDEATWELGPEAEPIEAPAPATTGLAVAPQVAPWFGEAVASRITRTAIEDGDDSPYYRIDRASADAFWGFVGSLGWPVATWDGWLDLCRTGSPVSFPEPASHNEPANDGHPVCDRCESDLYLQLDGWECFTCEDRKRQEQLHPTGPEPRPTRKPWFQPTPEMEMEALGFDLGQAGEHAQAPSGLPFSEILSFYQGFLAGRAALEQEFEAWLDELAAEQDRMDDAFGSPLDTWHPAELAEARGHAGHPA
jgi:hypothetical protein